MTNKSTPLLPSALHNLLALWPQEQERREAEERAQREAEAAAQAAQAAEVAVAQRQAALERKREQLADEPPVDQPHVKIAVQMPAGNRLTRRFSPTDTVQVLYDFVDVQDVVSGKWDNRGRVPDTTNFYFFLAMF